MLDRSFFRSRVARRVFLLFVISALVPILALALLSMSQVEQLLTQQGYIKLGRAGKAYGMSVYERLLLVETLLARVRSQTGIDVSAVHGATALRLVERAHVPPIHAARLTAGKPALETERTAGQPRVRLFVPATAGVWIVELDPAYLWGDPDTYPYATDFCAIDGRGQALHCSAAMPPQLLAQASQGSMSTAAGRLAWEESGERYIATYWGLFMRERYGIEGWTFVARQPLAEIALPARSFRSLFAAVLVLALLVVVLLSLTQIRRTLVPIEQLAAGTQRIARNDFGVRVHIDRQDEFSELAQAFNAMAARLGRQFQALTALSEVDRAILSTIDVERVLSTVLARMVGIVPYDAAAIAVLDRNNPDLARLTVQDASRDEAPLALRATCTAAERERLLAHPDGLWLAVQEIGYAAPLAKYGAARCFILPIIWKEALAGMVILGYRAASAELAEEERGHARDFADRVAVALSTAWREEQLHYQAHYDTLTRLPNRLSFQTRFARDLARAERENERVALLFIDLDHFKNVNDTLGHGAGDELLQHAADRLLAAVRPTDTVSRLGGDEFTVILPRLATPHEAGAAADRIVAALSQPFPLAQHEIFVGASIGIALYPDDGADGDTLLRNADTAMYRAKAGGRGCSVFFEEGMNREAQARVTLEREMRRALERNEFVLHYQPQFDVATGRPNGAEALVRWQHPERGLMAPVQFIGLAEETGLIEPLGAWVLREACAQHRRWMEQGAYVGHVAVNVSIRQFKQTDFRALVARTLHEHGIAAQQLELEITESLLVDQSGQVENALRELHDMGVRLALDDFGTGYSSMAYLRRFPVDVVKIDRAFIKDLGRGEDAEAITGAIVAMTHALGKKVLAEGVETPAQLAFLREHGCDHVQGFHFCRPLPAADFLSFLQSYRPAPA
jgi:diguanylate cyclase (GGDEF)-like protein